MSWARLAFYVQVEESDEELPAIFVITPIEFHDDGYAVFDMGAVWDVAYIVAEACHLDIIDTISEIDEQEDDEDDEGDGDLSSFGQL